MLYLFAFVSFFLLVLIYPINLKLDYENGKFRISLIFFCFRFNVLNSSDKNITNIDNSKKNTKHKKKLKRYIDYFKKFDLICNIVLCLFDLIRKIKIKKLFLELEVSSEDAYVTLRNFNLISNFVAFFYLLLYENDNIKCMNIDIRPDFVRNTSDIKFGVVFVFNIFFIFFVALNLFICIMKSKFETRE